MAARLVEDRCTTSKLNRRAVQPAVSVDDLEVQEVASRALDRCAAAASTWTPHTVAEHVTRITTEAGMQATPVELREFIDLATGLAVSIASPCSRRRWRNPNTWRT